jgi:cytochrome c
VPTHSTAKTCSTCRKVFIVCRACHQIGEAAKIAVGPVLNGVIGRKAGTYPGYSYSEANKNSGITWDEDTFTTYIKDPRAKIPGTKMIFIGIKDDQKIKDFDRLPKTIRPRRKKWRSDWERPVVASLRLGSGPAKREPCAGKAWSRRRWIDLPTDGTSRGFDPLTHQPESRPGFSDEIMASKQRESMGSAIPPGRILVWDHPSGVLSCGRAAEKLARLCAKLRYRLGEWFAALRAIPGP